MAVTTHAVDAGLPTYEITSSNDLNTLSGTVGQLAVHVSGGSYFNTYVYVGVGGTNGWVTL